MLLCMWRIMSGYAGDLSPQQAEALENLRTAVKDIPDVAGKDDYYFLRWLRARKFDARKAEDMLRNHMGARKKYGADTILTDYTPPEVLQKYFPGGLFGEDRNGHPVWYNNFNYDFRGLHRSVKHDDVLKLMMYRAEKCFALCEEFSSQKGRHIETVTFVMDYEKLSIQRHYYWPGIQLIRRIFTLFEANYPERVENLFLINTPSFFPVAYNLVKRFIDSNTRAKIRVLGSNWQEVLLEYISPDQLPQAYGGTRCEPDPYCTDHINLGGDIPETYYLANLMETSKEEMERVVIGRGSSHEVEYQVDLPKSVLKWEFVSTDHDIGFGWYLKRGKSDSEVVPMKRRSSHVIPENGVHVCDTDGKYVMKFDNSYSWTRSKEVFYSVKVLPPESEPFEITPDQEIGKDSDDSDEEFLEASDQTGVGAEVRESDGQKLFRLPPAVGSGLT